MYMKELKALERKKEKFNGFYYLFVKPKILVPRTTRPLNPKWASIDPLGSIRLVRLGSLDQCGFQKYKFYKYRFSFL